MPQSPEDLSDQLPASPSIWVKIDRFLATPRGRAVLAMVVAVTFLILGLSYLHKVRKGRSALLRWMPQVAELQEGKNIFLDPPEGYTFPHPPFAAINLYPYPGLPDQVAGAIWFLLRSAAFLASLAMIFSIVSERGAPFRPLAMLFVFILCMRTTESDLQHGNINLLILFWCTLAFWSFKKGRDGLAGLALAVGISLKITPALILVYFAYKRAWRVCLFTGIGLVACNALVPILFFGPEKTWEYSLSWYRGMVEPHMIEGNIDRNHINQSIQGVLVRYLTEPAGSNLELRGATSLLELPSSTARGVIRGVLVSLIVVLLLVCRSRTRPRDNYFLSVEFGLVLLTMLYFNERSWKHHYVLAALPYASWVYVIQQGHLGSRRGWISTRIWTGFLILSGAMVLFTSEDALGDHLSDLFEYYGGMFFSSLILYVGLVLLAWRAWRQGLQHLGTGPSEDPPPPDSLEDSQTEPSP